MQSSQHNYSLELFYCSSSGKHSQHNQSIAHLVLINSHFTSKIMIGNSNTSSTVPDVIMEGEAEGRTRVRQGPLIPDTVTGKSVG